MLLREGPGNGGSAIAGGAREDRGLVPGLRGAGDRVWGAAGRRRARVWTPLPSLPPLLGGRADLGPLGYSGSFRGTPCVCWAPPEPEGHTGPQRRAVARWWCPPTVSTPKGCRVHGAGPAAQASAPRPPHGPAVLGDSVLELPLLPSPHSQNSPGPPGSEGLASTAPPSGGSGVQASGLGLGLNTVEGAPLGPSTQEPALPRAPESQRGPLPYPAFWLTTLGSQATGQRATPGTGTVLPSHPVCRMPLGGPWQGGTRGLSPLLPNTPAGWGPGGAPQQTAPGLPGCRAPEGSRWGLVLGSARMRSCRHQGRLGAAPTHRPCRCFGRGGGGPSRGHIPS